MGFIDLLSDLYDSISFIDVHAEAPPNEAEDADEKAGEEDTKGEGEEEGEQEEGELEEGGEEGEEAEEEEKEEEEEEEEEEDEPQDLKPMLEEECTRSSQCAPLKHHYHECAERVRIQEENPDHKGYKEDCVEEFFHLSHCASQCAAPKLFRALK